MPALRWLSAVKDRSAHVNIDHKGEGGLESRDLCARGLCVQLISLDSRSRVDLPLEEL